jgi:hypothetical protein
MAPLSSSNPTAEQLERARTRLRKELSEKLTVAHRRFLLSVADGQPEWELMGFSHLREMPALRWKLQNLAKLRSANTRKFEHQAAALRDRLAG